MKRVLQFIIISFVVILASTSIVYSQEVKQLVAKAFTDICFNHLPDFSGAQETLEADNYILTPFGEGEFEFSHPSNGIWGAYAIGLGNGGCTVAHEGLTFDEAKQLAYDLMVNWLGGEEPELWNYEGEPSAYITGFESNKFYLIFNEGGLSADIRNQ